jgi:hypothetical protein
MEIEVSLLCLQEPTTGPCPEPDESSPHPYTLYILMVSCGHISTYAELSQAYAFLVFHVPPVYL